MNDAADTPDQQHAHWGQELARAKKRFRTFWDGGDGVVDSYRLQRADGGEAMSKDKYNILYSSTETIRPNLYAQQPKPRVVLRSVDTASDASRIAARLLEGCLVYVAQEEDFDELMEAAVEDYLLPGLGVAWARYEATFQDMTGDDGEPVVGDDGNTQQELLDEMVKIEYGFWQDFLCGVSRTWKEVPWVSKRLWLNKENATKRFGKDKADKLTYATREGQARDMDNPAETAEVWEIWNKPDKMVYWYGEGLTALLDQKSDPLKLKDFFPCPRPLRAISNTRTFVPRPFYSQYKSQAETLNVLTKRIRLLGEALRVVGMYDGSQPKLADILNPAAGNRMIAVDGWAQFAQNGGIKGSVEWVPIDTIVTTLNELLKAREICKQEIYEITGFSDVIRGVSKASETLGAQNLKADWAGARVKKMQKEVQRFARDLIALAGELIAEHCQPETIAVFSGMAMPDPSDPALQQKVQTFKGACDLIRNELRRLSTIDIETDSTLIADEESERDDRTKFLAAAGAFLQQSVPAMEATPELGPLLGAMLMFVVRTFPSSRPIEEEFEKVQQVMSQKMAGGGDQDKDGKKAAAAAAAAKLQQDGQLKQQELQVRQAHETATAQNEATAETNRHQEKMLELQIRQEEIALRDRELGVKRQTATDTGDTARENANTAKFVAVHAAAMAEMVAGVDDRQNAREEDLEYERMNRDDVNQEADRQAQADADDKAQETAQAAADAASTPTGSDD